MLVMHGVINSPTLIGANHTLGLFSHLQFLEKYDNQATRTGGISGNEAGCLFLWEAAGGGFQMPTSSSWKIRQALSRIRNVGIRNSKGYYHEKCSS